MQLKEINEAVLGDDEKMNFERKYTERKEDIDINEGKQAYYFGLIVIFSVEFDFREASILNILFRFLK